MCSLTVQNGVTLHGVSAVSFEVSVESRIQVAFLVDSIFCVEERCVGFPRFWVVDSKFYSTVGVLRFYRSADQPISFPDILGDGVICRPVYRV